MFARVEITPPDNDVFERDLARWNFKIDESITPAWWTTDYEKNARRSLKDCLEECLIDGQTLPLLENKNGLFIRNSKIEVVKNCNIREMRGSSQVGVMWGSSQVGVMWESSQVNVYIDAVKYSIEIGSNGLVILRHKKNIEIVHAQGTKVAVKEFKATKKTNK